MASGELVIFSGVKNAISGFTPGLWNNSRNSPAWMNGAYPAVVSVFNSQGDILIENSSYWFYDSGSEWSGDFSDKARATKASTADSHFLLSPGLRAIESGVPIGWTGIPNATINFAVYIYVNKWWDVNPDNKVYYPVDDSMGPGSKVVETSVVLKSTEQDGSRRYYVWMRATGVLVPGNTWGPVYEVDFGLNLQPKTYTVTFDANGSVDYPATVSPATASITEASRTITLPTPTRPGFSFTGWYTAASGGTQVQSPYTGDAADVTLYAHWNLRELICAFSPNGGFISGNYFVRVMVGGTFPALPTPTYSGNAFVGWYTAAIGGTLVEQGDSVTQLDDFVLYAHWSGPASSNTVYFNAMGGTISEESRTVTEGSALGTLPTPVRTGYTFVGWYAPDGTAITAATVMGTDDIYAIARWSATSVTITFDANGGAVDEASRAVAYGMQISTLPTPTRTDWKFDGWYTAATGGTQVFSTTIATADATIYAHWRAPEAVDWWGVTFG